MYSVMLHSSSQNIKECYNYAGALADSKVSGALPNEKTYNGELYLFASILSNGGSNI